MSWRIPKHRPHPIDGAISSFCHKLACAFGDAHTEAAFGGLRQEFENDPWAARQFYVGLGLVVDTPDYDRVRLLRAFANRNIQTDDEAPEWLLRLRDKLSHAEPELFTFRNEFAYYFQRTADDVAILNVLKDMEKYADLADLFLQGVVRALHDDAFDRVAFLSEAGGRYMADDEEALAWFQYLATRLFPI